MNFLKYCLCFIFTFMSSFSIIANDTFMDYTDSDFDNNMEFNAFLQRVDSLNSCYTKNNTRGYIDRTMVFAISDEAGRLAGGAIGKWAGGAIGSLSGNPIGIALGIALGRKIGPMLCGPLASAIVDLCIYQRNYISIPHQSASHAFDDLLTEVDDSICQMHNSCMEYLYQHPWRYRLNYKANIPLLYDDIVQYIAENGSYHPILRDNDFKSSIVNQIEKLTNISINYYIGPLNYEGFRILHRSYLFKECGIYKPNIELHDKYTIPLAEHCMSITTEEMDDYSLQLSELIRSSNMDYELKTKIATASQFTINSVICWNNVE